MSLVDRCATYTSLPSICKLVRAPGECCAKPDCEFSTQVGTFTGSGHASGPGESESLTVLLGIPSVVMTSSHLSLHLHTCVNVRM